MPRTPAALMAVAATVAALLVGAGPAAASAAPTSRPAGAITSAVQSRTGSITVTGWAYDRSHPTASISVCVWGRARCAKVVRADLASTAVDRSHRITGKHAFRAILQRSAVAVTVVLRVPDSVHQTLARATVSTPGARIVAVARAYVGKARYVDGGASPKGFDCSGYTRYAYRIAKVATLPHNAEAQLRSHGMRRISRASARPGDLIFYLSGSYAYHVAIYAGHGMQYAAATPRDGIRYQRVWSSDVEYRTDWH